MHAAHVYQLTHLLSGTHKAPHVGSVERFQDDLGLGEEELYCFTVDGCYPSKEDVCQGLGKYRVGVIAIASNYVFCFAI